MVTIEILQNLSGLHATVFLSIDPSRLYHSFAVADDRFTVVTTPISLSKFSSFCRHLLRTSLDRQGLSGIRLPRIVIPRIRFHTALVAEECVHRVYHRYESSISTGMCTSSNFVSVSLVSLRSTGWSANMAVRFSVDDFVVNRFFTKWPPVLLCASHFCLSSKLQA